MKKGEDIYSLNGKEALIFYMIFSPAIFLISYLFFKSYMLALFIMIFVKGLKPFYKEYIVNRKKDRILKEFKDFLYYISASISVSKSMEWAIKDSLASMKLLYKEGYMVKEIQIMVDSMENNQSSGETVLKEFSSKMDIEEIRDFVHTYSICIETGGNVKKALISTIGILSDKMNIRREIKAIIAQRQLEGKIVAAMPLVVLILLNAMSPEYLNPLYNTLGGRLIMAVSFSSYIFSSIWIYKILNWK